MVLDFPKFIKQTKNLFQYWKSDCWLHSEIGSRDKTSDEFNEFDFHDFVGDYLLRKRLIHSQYHQL
jgi:hypothetical protein